MPRTCSKNLLLALLTIAAIAIPAQLTRAADWQAGVAKTAITPDHLMWMSGYASRDQPAQGKLHDLWAKALVLQDANGNRAVLVTLDLVGVPRDFMLRVQADLKQKHQLEPGQISLCCSHTHTGPVIAGNLATMYFLEPVQQQRVDEYARVLQAKIVSAVGEAISKLAPAQLSWANGLTDFAVNRRNNPEADVPKLREAGTLRGPVDHDVPVLAVRDPAGQLLGVAFGYACHSTVLGTYDWSGDYPGFAQIALEKAHPGAVALFWAGCGADQNPLPRRTVELAQKYGDQLAAAVDQVLSQPMQPLTAELQTAYQEIPLPFGELPTREKLTANVASTDRYEASRAKALLAQLDAGQSLATTYPYPVQTWRLGNQLSWVMLGGEVVVDYSLLIKEQLGRNQTWTAGYANDIMAYIPSKRVLTEGGYEGGGAMLYYGLPTVWAPEVESAIVTAVAELAVKTGFPAASVGDERLSVVDHQHPILMADTSGNKTPITTPAAWAKRRELILHGIQQGMGPLPDRRRLADLDVRVLETIETDRFTRQKLTFVSEGVDRVPAYLFLPKNSGGKPVAAMLSLHQTVPQGKEEPAGINASPNRDNALELANRGYVVLAPDYPSFGEYQYNFHADGYASGSMKGIFNHMRAVDLLVARPEVDPARIGVIGHSLGGHNAMFVGAFDERLKVIVSSCGWTPMHDYYAGDLTGWTSDRYLPLFRDRYQLDPNRVPFDHYEIIAALAPRGFFSNSPLHDSNFEVGGVRKAETECRKVFDLLGVTDNLQVRYPESQHDFPPEVRAESYQFIDKALGHTPVAAK